MEQDLAILIADLSGYTALTEVHGAHAAADLIDIYQEIVERSLVGESRLQERVGDEVMILSPSADHLAYTAIELLYQASLENNFLHVHGGMHFGRLLNRKGSYFGPAINLTSRLTAQAGAGRFFCTKAFMDALKEPNHRYEPRGMAEFKNIRMETEIFELNPPQAHHPVDPVCRMLLGDNRVSHPTQDDLFFCSDACLRIYMSRLH